MQFIPLHVKNKSRQPFDSDIRDSDRRGNGVDCKSIA